MSTRAVEAIALAVCVVGLGLAELRWLRVAQREHYLPGATLRFARRWWLAWPWDRAALPIGLAGAIVSVWYPPAAFASAVVALAWPFGLGLRGRTSTIAWTGRLRRLALTSACLSLATVGVAGAFGLGPALSAAAVVAMSAPAFVDAALVLTRPVEARLLAPFVERARRRLAAVSPRVVAITGSYGKTTTKGYVAHLVGGAFAVVASPASFNNTAGLARAINEHLATGTQVFVAEMGTYGPGEIRAMCQWATPEVAVITAVGPVHIERMGTLERIAEAKAEILSDASVGVLNVDYPLLEELAEKIDEGGKTLWRCSSRDPRADVRVTREEGKFHVRVKHLEAELEVRVDASPEAEPGNVACAVAAALALGPQATSSPLASRPCRAPLTGVAFSEAVAGLW